MASSVETEVEIQDVGNVEIQEVEVEHIPVEMPIEIVETSEDKSAVHEMIFHTSHVSEEEIVAQNTGEEVVEDPNLVYLDHLPVAPEIEVSSDELFNGDTQTFKNPQRQSPHMKADEEGPLNDLFIDSSLAPRKWEQKQVQIKTLEGEFSVTMWASGKNIFYCRELQRILGNVFDLLFFMCLYFKVTISSANRVWSVQRKK